jgi:CxxC-x17-CxxC domain-containing protein
MKKCKGEPDISELINRMQQQLTVLGNKIDVLIGKSAPRPAEAKPFYTPFQQTRHSQNHTELRHGNNYRERILYKAVCADCRKECEVPFKPSGERPVYCKECFSKRRSDSLPKARPDVASKESGNPQAIHAAKPHSDEKRKSPRKRPAAKRRKTRS